MATNDVDDSYARWRASAASDAVIEEEAPVPYKPRQTYRPYSPRKPSRAAMAEADEASFAIDEVGDELGIDQRLERLSARIVRRMELDLQYFSVPQLLTGLQRCLQVRVLLLTIQQKGGGSNVGSAVRKYSEAFQPEADDARNGARNRRSDPEPDDLSNVLELISSDTDDADDDTGSRSTGKGRVAAGRAGGARSRNTNSRG